MLSQKSETKKSDSGWALSRVGGAAPDSVIMMEQKLSLKCSGCLQAAFSANSVSYKKTLSDCCLHAT